MAHWAQLAKDAAQSFNRGGTDRVLVWQPFHDGQPGRTTDRPRHTGHLRGRGEIGAATDTAKVMWHPREPGVP